MLVSFVRGFKRAALCAGNAETARVAVVAARVVCAVRLRVRSCELCWARLAQSSAQASTEPVVGGLRFVVVLHRVPDRLELDCVPGASRGRRRARRVAVPIWNPRRGAWIGPLLKFIMMLLHCDRVQILFGKSSLL